MRILTSSSNLGKGNVDCVKTAPQKEVSETIAEPVDKLDIQKSPGAGEKLVSLGKKMADYTKARYICNVDAKTVENLKDKLPPDKLNTVISLVNIPFLEEGFKTTLGNLGFTGDEIGLIQNYTRTSELGDTKTSSPDMAALGGGMEGFIFGGGVVGLVSGAIGGYAGTRIGMTKKSEDNPLSGDLNSLLGGVGVGAATGVAVTAALGAVFGGSVGSAATLTTAALLGGLSGASGSLSGNTFVSVRDGMSGGVLTGLVAQAITGNSAMALAGAVGGGVGGRAATTTGKIILGGGSGAVTGALTAVPALMALGTAGLPILAISAGAGAISGATGAIIGPVMRRTIRNITMDINQKVDVKMDKALEGHKIGTLEKTAAGAGMGVIILAPMGAVFLRGICGGLTGAAVAAGAGALIFGGKTLYDQLKKKGEEKKQEVTLEQTPDQTQEAKG